MQPAPAPFLCLALLAPALAQTEAAAVAPHVRIESVGPAGWRTRFAPTNLGSLLESQQGRKLWQPGLGPLLAFWRQLADSDAEHAAARQRLLDYGGRIRLAIWLQPGEFANQGPFAAALVLEGDGHTDLAALAQDVQRLQGQLDGEWRDEELDGLPLRVLAADEDRMSAPIVGEHHLLCVAAEAADFAAALANARAFAGVVDGKPPATAAPALRIEVALPALVAQAQPAADDAAAARQWATWQALGVECLGVATLTLATAGPHLQLELAQQFLDAPRGLFAALCRTATAVPGLRRLLPADRSSWRVGRIDWLALYDAIEAIAATNGLDRPELRQELHDALGVELRDDLLVHLTDEALLLGWQLDDPDRLDRTPWSLALRLRDRAAFEPNLETALAHAKPMLSREATIEQGDAKLHRYGALGYDLWFATGGDLFVVAGGADAEARLAALFAAARTPAEDQAPPLPAAHAALQRHLPPGLHGIGQGDLDSLAAIPVTWWLDGLSGLLPWPQAPAEVDAASQQAWRGLLATHGLDMVRTATGYAERTWRWRLFW
jgi:hypothetical protein